MPRPIIHHRDHEHGGADPVRIQWEQTGETGGGTGSLGQAVYGLDTGTSLGGLHLFEWSYVAGDALLDLTDDFHPSVLAAGVYAYNFGVNPTWVVSGHLHTGDQAMYEVVVQGSSGSAAGLTEMRYQPADEAIPYPFDFLYFSGTIVAHQDPASSDGAFVWIGVSSIVTVTPPSVLKYTGGCFIEKVA
jgi:hypothetical protein